MQFRRDSLDGRGLELIQTVHHRKDYNNASWNGQQMVYGDGDSLIFDKLTEFTVIGHEFSHSVVQFSGGLTYRDQSGALNESFADVFGSLTEQYLIKQEVQDASWLIGKGTLSSGINGDALRSRKTPGLAYDDPIIGKDPQPFHMDNFIVTSTDRGGVHINSGIPNHAFYLCSRNTLAVLHGRRRDKSGTTLCRTLTVRWRLSRSGRKPSKWQLRAIRWAVLRLP